MLKEIPSIKAHKLPLLLRKSLVYGIHTEVTLLTGIMPVQCSFLGWVKVS